ncbi:MAG: undecaprenyl-diphosphate phosphatase [Saccharofermentanales bacterium]|jgi:undecaprenyl-diphosphatase|nr:undecaprenyl-diphosphate phosphatase [Bacillota bacterium]
MGSWWDVFRSIIYGLVEGITEWLPISSTGHLILLEEWLPLDQSAEFFSMYLVVIQLGAIMAVVVTYWHSLWPFVRQTTATGSEGDLTQGARDSFGQDSTALRRGRIILDPDIFTMWLKILVACVPAAIIGLIFDDEIDRLFYNPWVVAGALIVVGVIFIFVEKVLAGAESKIVRMKDLSWGAAFVIGLFQLVAAIFPGVSRSGATIIGGLILGLSRVLAAEFTFYLAVPVMFGASLLKLVTYEGSWNLQGTMVLLTGMAVAFLVSLKVIEFLMSFIRKHDFTAFGYYRIALGMVVLLYFAFV